MRHNAIVVTSWSEESIIAAAEKASDLKLQVLGPAPSVINGYRSLMICPDGSKEEWADSDTGDNRRAAFKDWLGEQEYEDGSSNLDWVEIAYGSDDRTAEVVDHAYRTSRHLSRVEKMVNPNKETKK